MAEGEKYVSEIEKILGICQPALSGPIFHPGLQIAAVVANFIALIADELKHRQKMAGPEISGHAGDFHGLSSALSRHPFKIFRKELKGRGELNFVAFGESALRQCLAIEIDDLT